MSEEILKLRKEIDRLRKAVKKQRYGLVWMDVPEAFEDDVENKLPILKEVPKLAIKNNNGKPTHLLIEGDNFHALTCLNYTHNGKIDVIYIDPPYNTGSDGFKYKDKRILDRFPDGMKVPTDHPFRHSYWLSFMSKRLELAKDILKDSGVIFISIDDNEFAQLKLLCDEIFGSGNFVGMFSVENNPKGRKNSKFISVTNDYCLVYVKNFDLATFKKIIPKHAADMSEDEYGDFVRKSGKRVLMGENSLNKLVSNFKSSKHYSAYIKDEDLILKQEQTLNDVDKELIKKGYKRYITFRDGKFVENTYTKVRFKDLFEAGSLDIREEKIYEKHFSDLMQIKSMLTNNEYEAIVNNKKVLYKIDLKTTSARQQLIDLLGQESFIFPKNISFIKHLIFLHPNTDAVILDFFAGSGTTGHAVLEANKEDGGNRQFILVTNNDEVVNGTKYKIMSDVCYPRIKKISKIFKNGIKFYKTSFIGKNNILNATDQDKIELAHNAGELLAIAENTLELVKQNKFYQLFEDGEKRKYTAVYFREELDKFDEFSEMIKEITEPTAIYVFSWGDEEFFDDFADLKQVKVKTIPVPILEIYKQIYNLSTE